MTDRTYQSYPQGQSSAQQGGIAQFHPPQAVPLRSPGVLSPLPAPYALSVGAAQPYAAPAQAPLATLPLNNALPFGSPSPAQPAAYSAPPAFATPAPPAFISAPPSPATLPLGDGALPPLVQQPAMMSQPALVSSAPPEAAADAGQPISLQAVAVQVLQHGGPSAAPAAPHADIASADGAPPPALGPDGAPLGPGASPWAANMRVQAEALPSAHVMAAAREPEPPKVVPAPPSTKAGGRGMIWLLVVLLLAAGAGLAAIALRRHVSPNDPISIGVKEDGTKITNDEPEPSVTASTSASATAAPKAVVAPRPKVKADDPYDQRYPVRPPPPSPPPGKQYNPTDL